MNIIDFFNKYNGRGIDRDGAYGCQCMDLYNQFQDEVMGVKVKGAAYAKDVWTTYITDNFTKIVNTPTFVPQLGDVAVWGAVANNPYGHIAICTGNGDTNTFESFDQNYPIGSKCHYQIHNYFNGFLGVLRPKVGDIERKTNTSFWLRVDKKEAAVRSNPNTNSNLAGSKILVKGNTFEAIGQVQGENVGGNNIWYKSAKGNYVWSGGLTKI